VVRVIGADDATSNVQASTLPEVKQKPLANTQGAFYRGAFDSPTFFAREAMHFGKKRQPDFEAAITVCGGDRHRGTVD
jgi:2-hydroxychromene-2-carboxylate isomerase